MAGRRGRPRIKASDAAAEIQRQLQEITDKQRARLVARSMYIAEVVVEELKEGSPKSKGRGEYQGGGYSRGWTFTEELRNDGYGGKFIVYIVHNPTHYRLTHLLNNGHATVNGGWVNGDAHISKVHKEIPRKMLDITNEDLD